MSTRPIRSAVCRSFTTRRERGLEDGVFRLGTGKSAASSPMPRTLHQVMQCNCTTARRRRVGSHCQVGDTWLSVRDIVVLLR
nr:aromatic-ring-hydroxylating dioxygenase subunit beta [Paraburkholderia dipogonis]